MTKSFRKIDYPRKASTSLPDDIAPPTYKEQNLHIEGGNFLLMKSLVDFEFAPSLPPRAQKVVNKQKSITAQEKEKQV